MIPRPGFSRAAMCRAASRQDRRASLSVAESASDFRVVLNDFGGATAEAEVSARGMTMAELFVPHGRAELRRRDEEVLRLRHRYKKTPTKVVREMLGREIERLRKRDDPESESVRPLRTDEINAARARVSRILGIAPLSTVAREPWEGWAPWDTDPLWPALFERAVFEVMCERWGRQQAAAAERWPHLRDLIMGGPLVDPDGPSSSDYLNAATLAVKWLRDATPRSPRAVRPELQPFLVPVCDVCCYCHREGTAHPYEVAQAATRAALAAFVRTDA